MPMAEEAAICRVIEARNAAIRAGQIDQAIEPSSDDLVVYDLQPPLQFVGEQARDTAGLADWLATWETPVEIDMPSPVIAVAGDLAFMHGLSRMRGTKRVQGPVELWYRSTLCLRRRGAAWSIVHEHHSVPMKMDGSGLAAVDLGADDTDAQPATNG